MLGTNQREELDTGFTQMNLRYDLDKLGWFDFEQFCQSLLKAFFGPAVIAWGGRRDHGRDAYTAEKLPITKGVPPSDGPFIFQVKFVENANAAGAKPSGPLLNAIREEVKAIIAVGLATARGRTPIIKILMRNAGMPPDLRTSVERELKRPSLTAMFSVGVVQYLSRNA